MSTIVTMTADVQDYVNGQTYRVRSRFADHADTAGHVDIIDNESVVDADPIEGV